MSSRMIRTEMHALAATPEIRDLKGWRPKGPSKAMRKRFHRFQHRALVKALMHQAQELGARVLEVYARGTSRWACDDSGKVVRSKSNAQLATFATGKRYNADLNGALNIAARGLAMLLGIKPGIDNQAETGKSSGTVERMPLVLAHVWAYAQTPLPGPLTVRQRLRASWHEPRLMLRCPDYSAVPALSRGGIHAGPADGVGALEVCSDIERKLAWRPHDFEELEQLARSLEEQEPSSRAIRRLQGDGGTSAGGERPKVTVYDDGLWWLAKMRDRGDIPWLPAKEFVAMSLARDLKLKSEIIALNWRQRMRDLVMPLDEVERSAGAFAYATCLADQPGAIDLCVDQLESSSRRHRHRQ